DLGLYRKGAGKSHKFDMPGLVNVYCNVHPSMSSVIHIMGTPYYGFADANGVYNIADVPTGKYRLVAWNEQGGQSDTPVEITSDVPARKAYTVDRPRFPLVWKLFGLTALLILIVVAVAVGITIQRANAIAHTTVNSSISNAARLFKDFERQRLGRLALSAQL